MNSNDLINNIGKNANDTAALVWSVADDLVGAYKPHEYGLVILPMTVIKRFHDCLLPTHQAVLDTYKKVEKLAVKDGFLRKASGYQFYNTSPFTFKTLIADPENIVENFRAYLNGFSDNVLDILARMDFDSQIKHMDEAGLLYQVISDFCDARGDFSPEKISAVDMGYVFENLVRRFSESYNEEAGAHFTSRDIIYLMSDLLLAGDESAFTGDGISKTVYDMTMGTSQMLTCMEERLKQLDADANVTVFGQEFNPFTFGIAKADMLIRGGDPNNMQFGDTLSDDKFSGYKFDYVISNPPFNLKGWYNDNLKSDPRWADYSTPPESNANYAWILHILSHLKPLDGVAGFLLANGALGDEDTLAIRKKLIENDKVEAIIILPREMFITTDISVTLWILNQNKKGGEYHGRMLRNRENEILFIDFRTWSENSVKGENKKKVRLITEQVERAADIYHIWQSEGTDGENYALPELYRSVKIDEIEAHGWSLIPSKYIDFIDHDLEIDFEAEMARIRQEMRLIMYREKLSQKMLEDAFRGIGYEID